MITHVGFLIANPSIRNAIVLLALHSVQIVRILREDAVLARNPDYQAYRARVRWRLVPLIF
ncbi:MAG: hypothetical protein KGI51_11965 [Rhodospirillales bacterium]|nr:hypothetical protein [Rhodospirillales bacterium]